jgi:hypothetical protein
MSDEICGVCLDTVRDRGEIACGHLFCFACIERWVALSNQCPICKVRIRKISGPTGAEVQIPGDRDRQIGESEEEEVLDAEHWISDTDVGCVGDARCKWR